MMEQCPLCNKSGAQKVLSAVPLDYSSDQEWDIIKCKSCGHGFTMAAKYSTQLYEGGSYDIKEKFWHRFIGPLLSSLEKNKVKYIQEFSRKSARVLEVGSGKGRLIKALTRQGFDAYGLEPSRRSFEIARQLGCSTVYNCTIEQMRSVPALNQEYEFIVLWHVLEHLEDPTESIKLLREFLSEDGAIIIAVPNFDSWQAAFGGADWYHLDPSRHISHFTPRSLEVLAEKNHLIIKRMFFNSYYQDWIGDLLTLTNRLMPYKNMIFNFLRLNKNLLHKAGKVTATFWFLVASFLSVLFFPLTIILTAVSEMVKKSGTVIVVMGKQ